MSYPFNLKLESHQIMLTFYYAPGSCAVASHIALEYAGASYDARRVDFSKGEQREPAFLAINPKARVPALVTDRGTLTETPAMLAYIAQSFPDANLAPLNDPFAFAQIQAFTCYLCSTLHVAHAHKLRGTRWVDGPAAIAALKAKVPETVGACFAYIEEQAFIGPYVMGDSYSIADPYLFTVSTWMEGDSVDPAHYPKVAAHREMMYGRPSVQSVLRAQAE